MGLGMNAFSGLGGYMTLGLGAKNKPTIIKTADGEFVILKDSEFPSKDMNIAYGLL
jgi:hypothetical protein